MKRVLFCLLIVFCIPSLALGAPPALIPATDPTIHPGDPNDGCTLKWVANEPPATGKHADCDRDASKCKGSVVGPGKCAVTVDLPDNGEPVIHCKCLGSKLELPIGAEANTSQGF